MFAPFFRHWYSSGVAPAAATVNVADCPTVTDWLTGCVTIDAAALLGGGFADLLPELAEPAHPARTSPTRTAVKIVVQPRARDRCRTRCTSVEDLPRLSRCRSRNA